MSACLHLGMGWLRLVGSLKLQVSFKEYSLFYRALLQKVRLSNTDMRHHMILTGLYSLVSVFPTILCICVYVYTVHNCLIGVFAASCG